MNNNLHNDDITTAEFKALRASMQSAIERLQTGLKYGADMKSSVWVCAVDAANVLDGILSHIGEGRAQS